MQPSNRGGWPKDWYSTPGASGASARATLKETYERHERQDAETGQDARPEEDETLDGQAELQPRPHQGGGGGEEARARRARKARAQARRARNPRARAGGRAPETRAPEPVVEQKH